MTQEPMTRPTRGSGAATVIGGLLIAAGLLFLLGELLNANLSEALWPLYVLAPGLALVVLGLTQRHGSGLTIAGSVVTMVGLLLLYQNATDHWQSWAYAWPLVAPGGSGLGMLLYGTRSGNGGMARAGFWQIVTGLALFVAGILFFEGVLGISGNRFPLPSWFLPGIVILLGVLLLLRGMSARSDIHSGEVEQRPQHPAHGRVPAPSPVAAEAAAADSHQQAPSEGTHDEEPTPPGS
jgi:hypothetical protein